MELGGLERVKGIEPSYAAWEAAVLPLNYTRIARHRAVAGLFAMGSRPFQPHGRPARTSIAFFRWLTLQNRQFMSGGSFTALGRGDPRDLSGRLAARLNKRAKEARGVDRSASRLSEVGSHRVTGG